MRPPQVAPVVKYYQCDVAREFLADEVDNSRSLAAMAAYESVFCDGGVEEWSDNMLQSVAEECTWLERWDVERTGAEARVWGESRSVTVGKLCVQRVDNGSLTHLESLRPQTLVKLMARIVESKFCINQFAGTARPWLVAHRAQVYVDSDDERDNVFTE